MIAAGSPRAVEDAAITRRPSRERWASQQEGGHAAEAISVPRRPDRACDQRAHSIRRSHGWTSLSTCSKRSTRLSKWFDGDVGVAGCVGHECLTRHVDRHPCGDSEALSGSCGNEGPRRRVFQEFSGVCQHIVRIRFGETYKIRFRGRRFECGSTGRRASR